MPEWAESLLAAVGGGAVVVVGILTIFKKLFLKLFDVGIGASFEKKLEKFKNKLERSTRAYEILLDREMRFYEHMEPISAKLVPLLHDLGYLVTNHDEIARTELIEEYRNRIVQYGELTKTIKNEVLTHQAYIPAQVFATASEIIKRMQGDIVFWADIGRNIASEAYDKIDYSLVEEKLDQFISLFAKWNVIIRDRLTDLSEV